MNQLITDQLIEKYEHTIINYKSALVDSKNRVEKEMFQLRLKMTRKFITDLKSLRQQEVQNVMTAYRDGDVLRHLYKDSEDYFNQTFKQNEK